MKLDRSPITLKERVLILKDSGLPPETIAEMVDRSIEQVRGYIWKRAHPKRAREIQRRCDSQRYGTPEYRKKEAEYRRKRYHEDADFRQRHIDAVARSQAKKKQREGKAAR